MGETRFRPAAGRPIYEVRETRAGAQASDYGSRFEGPSYAAAVEYAFEYLGRADPRREGKVHGLQVVRVDGRRHDVVWTYTHDEEPTADEGAGTLVRKWGYDVSRGWHAPAQLVVRPTPLRRTLRPLRRV